MKFHFAGDADNLKPAVIRAAAIRIDRESFADRILSLQIFIGQALIDNRYQWRVLHVALVESSSAQERRLERTEVIARDRFAIRARFLTRRRRRRAFTNKRNLPVGEQRWIGAGRGFLDSGQSRDLVEKRLREIDDLVVFPITGVRHIDTRAQ